MAAAVGAGSSRAVSATSSASGAMRPTARSRVSCASHQVVRYGGSRKTRLAASPGGAASASIASTVQQSSARQAAMLARNAAERGVVLLDERCVRRAARQRFQAERTGAGEDVQHMGAFDNVAPAPRRVQQHIEQRLAHAVGGRTRRGCPAARSACARAIGRRRSSLCKGAGKQGFNAEKPEDHGGPQGR